MKFDIHSKDLKLVEKKKLWFMIPGFVLAIAIVMGLIFGFVTNGNVLNLGMDFTGGYSLTVKLGTELYEDPDFRAEKEEIVTDIIENPNDYADSSTRNIEGLKVKSIALQGSGANTALYVKFTADQYNYQVMVGNDENDGIITILSDLIQNELFADNIYFGQVESGDSVSATVSSELLITCICGVLMSLALMLIYIAIRFELLSGVVAMICLSHDIAIMFLFMLIFHIEITSTFVAALITILGYSINNTIIIFDKVRDNLKTYPANSSPSKIANDAVRDTVVRSMNTTGTTLVTVIMVAVMAAIFGVGDLITFCLPLIAGLAAGTFSSIFLAPSIWSMWKERQIKKAPATETLSPEDGWVKVRDDFFTEVAPVAPKGEVSPLNSSAGSGAEIPETDDKNAVSAVPDEEDIKNTDGEGKPSETDGN